MKIENKRKKEAVVSQFVSKIKYWFKLEQLKYYFSRMMLE